MNNDWKTTKFSNIAKLTKGISYKSSDYCKKGEGAIFVTLKCIAKSGGFSSRGIKYFKGTIPEEQILQKNDLLFANTDLTRNGDIVGCPVYLPDLGDEFPITMSMDLSRVDFIDEENIDAEFVYYQLMTDRVRSFMKDNSSGSTVLHLNTSKVYDLDIFLPKLKAEQTRIAEILGTADASIAETERLIAKYNRIKTGLMQDLLTRGIDAGGNIRSKSTHKFVIKNGIEVPEDWDVCIFEECYRTPIRDFGSFSSTKLIEFLDEGVPFIKSEMIRINKIDWSSVSYISKEVHQLLKKSYVKKGNLLFSKIGSALGKAVVYEGNVECNSNAAVAKIDLNLQKANNYFICYFLNFEFAQTQFKNMIVSLLPRLNLGDINNLIVMLPPINEQKKIADTLLNLEDTINQQKVYLSKLFSLKTGLMQDLLSGNKRVV